jgi:hypothetical protein
VLQFYAQREMVFGVTDPAALSALPIALNGRAFVATDEWLERRPALQAHLKQRYARRASVPLVVFDLSRDTQLQVGSKAPVAQTGHD